MGWARQIGLATAIVAGLTVKSVACAPEPDPGGFVLEKLLEADVLIVGVPTNYSRAEGGRVPFQEAFITFRTVETLLGEERATWTLTWSSAFAKFVVDLDDAKVKFGIMRYDSGRGRVMRIGGSGFRSSYFGALIVAIRVNSDDPAFGPRFMWHHCQTPTVFRDDPMARSLIAQLIADRVE